MYKYAGDPSLTPPKLGDCGRQFDRRVGFRPPRADTPQVALEMRVMRTLRDPPWGRRSARAQRPDSVRKSRSRSGTGVMCTISRIRAKERASVIEPADAWTPRGSRARQQRLQLVVFVRPSGPQDTVPVLKTPDGSDVSWVLRDSSLSKRERQSGDESHRTGNGGAPPYPAAPGRVSPHRAVAERLGRQ